MAGKKRGSSMVVVVVIMAVIFSLGTTMLTLAAGDYKNRISESQKLKNLYMSDSNLDVVYNLILKSSQSAIEYSSKKVVEKYGEAKYEDIKEDANKLFKDKFIEYLNDNKDNLDLVNVIESGKYLILDELGNKRYKQIGYDEGTTIKIVEYSCIDKEITFKVNSTFEIAEGTSTLRNTKTVSTKFTINAPDYIATEIDNGLTKTIDIYPVFNGKVITADGDMSVNNTIDIKGDVWIKGDGTLGDNPAYAFDKYNGGILVDEGALKISEGNLLTSQTLTLRNKAVVEAENIYALNTYVGPKKSGTDLGENKLTVTENLVTNNDLSLNSNNSKVNLKNYFGINEYTISSEIQPEVAARESSSIIINNENSSLQISNEAYIMGVAYIDTDEKYRTGESLAVKGNYLAYTEIVPGYEDKVTLKYYSPLQLIDKIENNDSAQAKSAYFNKYYAGKKAKNGGVTFNKIYSVGAVIDSEGNVSEGNILAGNSVINDLRDEYAKEVLSMGDTGKVSSTSIYNEGNVVKKVADQIAFNKIDEIDKEKLSSDYGQVVLINDQRDYKISSEMKGLIISNGKVIIEEGAKFTGNIITTEDVEVKGKAELNYDDEVTTKIIASNYDKLNILFINSNPIMQKEVQYNKTTIGSHLNDYGSEFIKAGYWKIIK